MRTDIYVLRQFSLLVFQFAEPSLTYPPNSNTCIHTLPHNHLQLPKHSPSTCISCSLVHPVTHSHMLPITHRRVLSFQIHAYNTVKGPAAVLNFTAPATRKDTHITAQNELTIIKQNSCMSSCKITSLFLNTCFHLITHIYVL